ncbi:hypothetical protein LTS18_007854 [Coniosporium uncinatum]|uniref:Uncharacterized protein n=1 Tax=Coniosporium uncinatum TaxID=93489 RepID=A0ACC3DZX3_9PEZI|nr:hypothetical protein LTS18_007854 [Coniosporium uncinatum]
MPSRATATTTLSNLVEPMSEDEFAQEETEMMPTPDSGLENAGRRKPGAASNTAARAKATVANGKIIKATTKPMAASRRASGASTVAGKKAASKAVAKKRTALTERNAPNAIESEIEEVSDFDEQDVREDARDRYVSEDEETAKPTKKGRAIPKKNVKGVQRSEIPARARGARPVSAQKKTKAKRVDEPTGMIPETQPEPMEIEQSELPEQTIVEDQYPEPAPKPAARPRQPAPSRARSSSRQPQPIHRRAGSASDTERDPTLRRKLGEMTKKFESVDLKYRNIKEVGMTDAQTNFEKLRNATDQRAKDQDELIASLKKELAVAKSRTSDSSSLRSQTQSLTTENARLKTENTRLNADNKTSTTFLHEAQNEIKSLKAKLETARVAQASEQKVPGSAAKTAPVSRKQDAAAAAGATQEAKLLKLKEDLYSDLTGLMIRSVKRIEGEDVYDCIQTGRNGTLRFHIAILDPSDPINAAKTPGGANSYEDAEFAYTPLLDEKNDRELLEILPDYLTEEICFPRSSAAKFYAKVQDCMTRRVVVEE